ncbi:DUF3168 domain-containing protein [Sphingomonas sp. Leaf4]|uniref:DUF3168 domain-containing protein n=1 Tax=Sphingomonas sp. Leaf4 TaxID=2876553 RepID=UPI001E51ADB4|nr:DUF3168 domain-containing protein [Sphingomonas sp. Leaf4]
MIAATLMQAMLVARVRAAIPEVAVFDAAPVRGHRPYVLIDTPALGDWGTKDAAGREGRVVVQAFDTGERPERLRDLAARVEAAVLSAPAELAGWRVASLVFLRGRIAREGEGRWVAVAEFRVRMLAV